MIDGVPRFVQVAAPSSCTVEKAWLNRLKNRLKIHPRLYEFLTAVCSPAMPTGKSSKILLDRMQPDAVILNLGSGTKRISHSIVNVDLLPFANVDIVADAARLPFQNDSIDGIISEASLEHVRNAQAAIEEMHRVLKKGGYLYLIVPFMVGYHPSPCDYRRWTLPGIIDALEGLEVVESGIRGGPTSAFLWILQEWLAMALSFNIAPLYVVIWIGLMALTFPIKLLDLLLSRYSMAWKIAATFYYLGVKT